MRTCTLSLSSTNADTYYKKNTVVSTLKMRWLLTINEWVRESWKQYYVTRSSMCCLLFSAHKRYIKRLVVFLTVKQLAGGTSMRGFFQCTIRPSGPMVVLSIFSMGKMIIWLIYIIRKKFPAAPLYYLKHFIYFISYIHKYHFTFSIIPYNTHTTFEYYRTTD
jgi:hypothetical protein